VEIVILLINVFVISSTSISLDMFASCFVIQDSLHYRKKIAFLQPPRTAADR